MTPLRPEPEGYYEVVVADQNYWGQMIILPELDEDLLRECEVETFALVGPGTDLKFVRCRDLLSTFPSTFELAFVSN